MTMRKRLLVGISLVVLIGVGLLSFQVFGVERPTSMVVVIDSNEQNNRWMDHTYPNDQNDPGVSVLLVMKKDLDLAPGQVIEVTGRWQGWMASERATVVVTSVKTDVPQTFPNYVHSSPTGSATLAEPAYPSQIPNKTNHQVVFEEARGADQWITRRVTDDQKVIVILKVPQEVIEHRFPDGLKGVELLVIGEDKGKDDRGRPVIMVTNDWYLKDPKQP